jgi:hypothetical protein
MHARIQPRILPETIGARLTVKEKERVQLIAREEGLTPSEYVRQVVVESLNLGPGFRLVLGEICATRRQMEALLALISDLNDKDLDRARSDADLIRPALIRGRILELQKAREVPPIE